MSRKTMDLRMRVWSGILLAVGAAVLMGCLTYYVEGGRPGFTGEYDTNGNPIITVDKVPPPTEEVVLNTTGGEKPTIAPTTTAPPYVNSVPPRTATQRTGTVQPPSVTPTTAPRVCATCVRPGVDIPGDDGTVTPPPPASTPHTTTPQ